MQCVFVLFRWSHGARSIKIILCMFFFDNNYDMHTGRRLCFTLVSFLFLGQVVGNSSVAAELI